MSLFHDATTVLARSEITHRPLFRLRPPLFFLTLLQCNERTTSNTIFGTSAWEFWLITFPSLLSASKRDRDQIPWEIRRELGTRRTETRNRTQLLRGLHLLETEAFRSSSSCLCLGIEREYFGWLGWVAGKFDFRCLLLLLFFFGERREVWRKETTKILFR